MIQKFTSNLKYYFSYFFLGRANIVPELVRDPEIVGTRTEKIGTEAIGTGTETEIAVIEKGIVAIGTRTGTGREIAIVTVVIAVIVIENGDLVRGTADETAIEVRKMRKKKIEEIGGTEIAIGIGTEEEKGPSHPSLFRELVHHSERVSVH